MDTAHSATAGTWG